MDTYATRAIPAEVIRYFLRRVTASLPEMRLDQYESILPGAPRSRDIRLDLTERQWTVPSKLLFGAADGKDSPAARKHETATAREVFDFIDKEPGVS